MNFNIDYLKKLAGIPTPRWKKNMGNDEEDQQNSDYTQLRNFAKDLLDNSNDKKAEKKLSRLIKKLEIDIK